MAITFDFMRNAFLKPLKEVFCAAQISQYNRPWLAVDSSGFDDAPVSVAFGYTFLKCCHISVYT
jgi:hypothetical protein